MRVPILLALLALPSLASADPGVAAPGAELDAATRGVRRYRLLVSPELFDLSEPITVRTNGAVSFSRRVRPDVATLLAWASRDQDRTMLFAAEIEVGLAPL